MLLAVGDPSRGPKIVENVRGVQWRVRTPPKIQVRGVRHGDTPKS